MTRGCSLRVAALSAVCVLAGSLSAEAQFQPQARPRHGFLQLQSGFQPDPAVLQGVMGGNVQATQFGPNCRGSIFPEPSHVIRSRSGFRLIRFVVAAGSDSTLMVQLPNGQILCDDDSGGNSNPLIETASPPGDIRVWVGVYSASTQNQPYSIGFTELSHITYANLTAGGRPPPPGYPQQPPPPGGINPNGQPMYGAVQLRSGFMPDPQVVAGHAGGTIQASTADGSCRGWITSQPSHVITSQTGFRNLRFAVNSAIDTTLVVMLPNGQFACDDDGGDSGMNPLVQVSSPPGAIRVWIGTYAQGQTGPYNIGFSELPQVDTSAIPPPGGQVVVRPPPPGQNFPPPQPQGEQVQMTVGIPVTLFGPGMDGNTIAVWSPSGAGPTQVAYQGRAVIVGGVSITHIPPAMSDPIVTVVQLRNGGLVIRAEQPPTGRADRGQALVLLVRHQGRPTVAEQWVGTAVQRAPRWSG